MEISKHELMKIDLFRQELWDRHLLCFRDDCVRFAKSNFRNPQPMCETCNEYHQFRCEMVYKILEEISKTDSASMSFHFLEEYMNKLKSTFEYLSKKNPSSNYEPKPSVEVEKETLTIDPTTGKVVDNKAKFEHDDEEPVPLLVKKKDGP